MTQALFRFPSVHTQSALLLTSKGYYLMRGPLRRLLPERCLLTTLQIILDE